MGPAAQKGALEMAEAHGAENVLVVVAFQSVFTLQEGSIGYNIIQTFMHGDTSWAEGAVLSGVALGVKTYHIFELKDQIPEDVWETQGMDEVEMQIPKVQKEKIINRIKELRGDA